MDSQNNTSAPEQAPQASQPSSSTLSGLEGFFDTYLRVKAPFQLPVNVKEFIVKYGPWITLVILIIAAVTLVPLAMLALGLSVISLPFAAMAGQASTTTLGFVQIGIGLVILVMEAVAIPGLLKRKLSGWKILYYATLLSAVSSLLNMSILSFVLGLLIGMYFLFQIREYYK